MTDATEQGTKRPEDLWLVEWPTDYPAREIPRRFREAERLLDGLIDIAQRGTSDVLFVVLADAKVRCKKYRRAVEAADREARAETLRAELRELEAAEEGGGA